MIMNRRTEQPTVVNGSGGNVQRGVVAGNSQELAPATDNRRNYVFETLWQQAAQASGHRVVKRGKSPQGHRAILLQTFGLRRAAIIEHDREPGFLVRLIDGKGSNQLIGEDGTILFPRPIHSHNLVRLGAALDEWLEACDLIYGLAARQNIHSGTPEGATDAQGTDCGTPLTGVPAANPYQAGQPASTGVAGGVVSSEEWPTGDGGVNP